MKRVAVVGWCVMFFVTGCGSGKDVGREQVKEPKGVETQERTMEIGGVVLTLDDHKGDTQRWVVLTDAPENYLRNYRAWRSDKNIIPEVDTAVVKWLEGESETIQKLIINAATGVAYRVDGSKWNGGAKVRIVYMGKLKE